MTDEPLLAHARSGRRRGGGADALPVWPLHRLDAALAAVADLLGMDCVSAPIPPDVNVATAAERIGLEAEAVEGWLSDVAGPLRRAVPAVIAAGEELVVVVRAGRRRAVVLGPDARARRIAISAVVDAMVGPVVAPWAAEVDASLRAIGIEDRRTTGAFVRARLRALPIMAMWAIRPVPGATLRQLARSDRLGRRLAVFVACNVLGYAAFVASWAVLGAAALGGRPATRTLLLWGVLLVVSMALQSAGAWLEGLLGIKAGWLVRRRLLYGALRLEPDEIRHQGIGRLMGRVLESEVAEDVAIGGGLLAAVATAQLAVAGIVLARSAARVALPLLLVGGIAGGAVLAAAYLRARRSWTAARLAITDRLVEVILGHRTRLTQQQPARWHEGEDEVLADYGDKARRMDGHRVGLVALVPRGWMLAALAVLAASGGSRREVAIAVGGILLAEQAFERITQAGAQLADASVAWQQVVQFFVAARRPVSLSAVERGYGEPVLRAVDLVYQHAGRRAPVLRGCDVMVPPAARILLEGPSGSGKSTLAAVLAGLRTPSAGQLLLGGRRPDEVGEREWRRRVSLSPQFHENHVMLAPLAFNLLMGRGWPPGDEDLRDAWALCQRIGLGPVLDRMPSGLQEIVGDSGWQLSRGETSLVFLARSLLQRSDIVLLDESFGSLDPLTLQQALSLVVAEAPALVVIRQ